MATLVLPPCPGSVCHHPSSSYIMWVLCHCTRHCKSDTLCDCPFFVRYAICPTLSSKLVQTAANARKCVTFQVLSLSLQKSLLLALRDSLWYSQTYFQLVIAFSVFYIFSFVIFFVGIFLAGAGSFVTVFDEILYAEYDSRNQNDILYLGLAMQLGSVIGVVIISKWIDITKYF